MTLFEPRRFLRCTRENFFRLRMEFAKNQQALQTRIVRDRERALQSLSACFSGKKISQINTNGYFSSTASGLYFRRFESISPGKRAFRQKCSFALAQDATITLWSFLCDLFMRWTFAFFVSHHTWRKKRPDLRLRMAGTGSVVIKTKNRAMNRLILLLLFSACILRNTAAAETTMHTRMRNFDRRLQAVSNTNQQEVQLQILPERHRGRSARAWSARHAVSGGSGCESAGLER